MTAAGLGVELRKLTAQRIDAAEAGLSQNRLYMDQLDAEIVACRSAYIGAAVSEVASLRAQPSGRLQG